MIRYEISSSDEHWQQIQELLASIYMTSKTEIAISRTGASARASYPGFLNEHLVCCAFLDQELVGYCRASVETYEVAGQIQKLAYIGDHRVNPAHRGQRVAARLAEELIAALGRMGVPRGFYYVNDGNLAQEKMMSRIPNLSYHQGAEFVTSSLPLLHSPRKLRQARYMKISDPENCQPPWLFSSRLELGPLVSSEQWVHFIRRFPEIRFYASIDSPSEIKFALFNQGQFKQIKMQNYSFQTKLTTWLWNAVALVSGAAQLPHERETWSMTELCFCQTDFILDHDTIAFAKREAFSMGSQILNLISKNNGISRIAPGVRLPLANHLHTHLKLWALSPHVPIRLTGDHPFVDPAFV